MMQASDSKEERVLLLDSWLAMEEGMGEAGFPHPLISSSRPIPTPCPLAPSLLSNLAVSTPHYLGEGRRVGGVGCVR